MKLTRQDIKRYREEIRGVDDTIHHHLTELLIDNDDLAYIIAAKDYPKLGETTHENGHDCWGKSEYWTSYYILIDGKENAVDYDNTILLMDKDDKIIGLGGWRVNVKFLKSIRDKIIATKQARLQNEINDLP